MSANPAHIRHGNALLTEAVQTAMKQGPALGYRLRARGYATDSQATTQIIRQPLAPLSNVHHRKQGEDPSAFYGSNS